MNTRELPHSYPVYMDKSGLLENTPLVKFVRNYIRGLSGVYSYPHVRGYRLPHFAPLQAKRPAKRLLNDGGRWTSKFTEAEIKSFN